MAFGQALAGIDLRITQRPVPVYISGCYRAWGRGRPVRAGVRKMVAPWLRDRCSHCGTSMQAEGANTSVSQRGRVLHRVSVHARMLRMILAEVRDEVNQINRLLDEFHSVRIRRANRERRAELLERAVRASARGVAALVEDQRTKERLPIDVDVYRVAEELRQDEALLRLFLNAETQLLLDIGVEQSAVDRIKRNLEEVLLDLAQDPEPATDQLEELLSVLEKELQNLVHSDSDQETLRRVVGALQAIAGGLVVAVNGVAGVSGAAAGPVLILTAAGAGLSIAAGTEVMNRGARRALDG